MKRRNINRIIEEAVRRTLNEYFDYDEDELGAEPIDRFRVVWDIVIIDNDKRIRDYSNTVDGEEEFSDKESAMEGFEDIINRYLEQYPRGRYRLYARTLKVEQYVNTLSDNYWETIRNANNHYLDELV